MESNEKYKILYEKDFKEDIELMSELCESMLFNVEYSRENAKKCIENDGNGNILNVVKSLHIDKRGIESIKEWCEGVLNKVEKEKENGRKSLGKSIKEINYEYKLNK